MAGNSYQPGDFILNNFSLSGLKVNAGFISASVYESIFMPCIVAEINVRDTDDALFGGLNLSGGEEIQFAFSAPGGDTASYKLLVNKPENMEPSQSMKSRTIQLIASSEEAFYASGGVDAKGYIQKSYNGRLISYNVQDVLKSYLKTKKKITVEETKGPQNIIANNEKAWVFIDRIRRRAVSANDKSSSYVFFENKDGFNFITIEKLFRGSVVKSFIQDNTVGTDITKLNDNIIIGYELPYLFNAMDRIDRGTMSSRYTYFNFETNEYTQKVVSNPDMGNMSGGSKSWNSTAFLNKFGKTPGRTSNMPYDNRLPITGIPQYTPNQLAYSGNLMQNIIKLRVIGDAKIKAGDMINAKIIQQNSLTSPNTQDTDISGNMLIASIRHLMNPEGMKPQYTCILDCLKGKPG